MPVTWSARLLSLKPVSTVLKLSGKIVFPGMNGLTLYEVASFFYTGVSKGSITARASSIAFNFFLATFPAIIFFFTIIPYIPVANFQTSLMSLLKDMIPEHAYYTIESTIIDIITRPRKSLLSLGFIMALYFSTNGINSILEAFDMTVHAREKRTWFKQKLIAIFLVILLAFLTIIAIVLITSGTLVLDFLVQKHILKDWDYYYLLQFGKWVVITSLLYFAISSLYFFGPVRKSRFRFFSAGATLASILTLAISIGFDFYVSNFSKYNALYGSIGTLIILLLWIYFNSNILLIGFELNASILSADDARKGKENKGVKEGSGRTVRKTVE
ncbi:MAG: YihY/virulence factor BrkB family protein [Bacteroidetes bacterium]|nr:YihY/virulence factor BrkB family protein [Bacteroidota bacterium]